MKMSDKLLVEVQGENGAYYKAYVTEVCPEEIRLAFELDWQPESKFPLGRVRLPPPVPATPPEFHTGQEIEVSGGAWHLTELIKLLINFCLNFKMCSTPKSSDVEVLPVILELKLGGKAMTS